MGKSYGELVRSYREAAGLTQEKLAALSGLGVRTISDIERGLTTRPHASSAERLSCALGQEDLASGRVTRSSGPGMEAMAAPKVPGGADEAETEPAQHAGPRQLPGGVRHFTGRTRELAALTQLAGLADADGPGIAVVSAIGGTAGVGKTALAVHWAHHTADRFPDGQLYVDLRGYDPAQPMAATDALAGFLRALGMPGQDIPADTEERAARYRSLLTGRRVVVVLDNARTEEQVRPLLPGNSACMTVVTSRDALAGLVARHGAVRLDLDLLPLAEAVRLLRALIGTRAAADPRTTEALAVQCCRLPLALRVAAELAVARADDSLAGLVIELTDQQRRLDVLDAGEDPRTAVRAVLSWSYRQLDADAARMFRLAGLHPGPDLDAYAAAALTADTTVDQAGRLLQRLARAHLIHATRSGRYGMHDLLRAYATGQVAAQDGNDAARAALTRLFDYYLHAAALAMDTLIPAERHRRPRIPAPATPGPALTDPTQSRAWLDAERAVLVAAVVHAADHGWPGHATDLATTLFRYFDTGAYYAEGITIHTCARQAARRTGDQVAEARALNRLGVMHNRQARYPQATRHYQQALDLFRQAGDHAGEAYALGNLGEAELRQSRYRQATRHLRQAMPLFHQTGNTTGEAYAFNSLGEIDARQGRYPQAIRHYQQARDLFRQAGDRTGEAYTLSNLGDVDLRQGRYPQATRHLRQALDLFHQASDRTGEGYALTNLGEVELRQGRYPQAAREYQRCLTLFREVGDQTGEAYALVSLGDVDLCQGRSQHAARYQQQALALYRRNGDPYGEALALNGLGEALLAAGQPGHARTQHTAALTLARRTSDKQQQARALHGLGHTYHAISDPEQARRHWQDALALYASLEAPDAERVRASLRDLDQRTGQPTVTQQLPRVP